MDSIENKTKKENLLTKEIKLGNGIKFKRLKKVIFITIFTILTVLALALTGFSIYKNIELSKEINQRKFDNCVSEVRSKFELWDPKNDTIESRFASMDRESGIDTCVEKYMMPKIENDI